MPHCSSVLLMVGLRRVPAVLRLFKRLRHNLAKRNKRLVVDFGEVLFCRRSVGKFNRLHAFFWRVGLKQHRRRSVGQTVNHLYSVDSKFHSFPRYAVLASPTTISFCTSASTCFLSSVERGVLSPHA